MNARQIFAAWLTTLGVVAAELLVVYAARRTELVSVWEVQWGTLWLLPVLILAATAGALVGVLLLALVAQIERRRARVLLTFAAFAFGAERL